MKYLESEEQLRRSASLPGGKALVRKMKEDVDWFSRNFSDDPAVDSGWGHQYFCPDDGAFLIYDRESPLQHRCPICGKLFEEANYSAAWRYLYRYDALMSALEAAVLYRLSGEEMPLRHFMRIVGFYSEHYGEFAVHGKGPTTSGNGKITPQALNEAIFLAKTVDGLELLKDVLPASFVSGVTQKLLLPGARFVNAQKKIIHNIPCWINAAVGTVGLFAGDEELIRLAFDAPLGLSDQVRQGVTKSFFWYEGSIHYNCFTIESMLHLFLSAGIYGKEIPADVRDTVYQMMLAPCKLSFSNAVLPNPNDGWPNLNLKTYSYLYETAAKIFDSDELRNILANIYAQPVQRTPLPMSSPVYCGDWCMERLLFSRGDQAPRPLTLWKCSWSFEASNYVLLRSKSVEAFLKYGHCTPSHAHPDKMNVEITAFGSAVSRDLSNCGYAARLCGEYHRTSVSHCTVVADGLTHPTTERGICEHWEETIPEVLTKAKEAYPGVDFQRGLRLSSDGLRDSFLVEADRPHVFDWFFHCEGRLNTMPECVPESLGFSQNGYQHLQNVRRILTAGDSLTLNWHFSGGVTGTQTVDLRGLTAYLCDSYDNPVNKMRVTLILRAQGSRAEFIQEWKFFSGKAALS